MRKFTGKAVSLVLAMALVVSSFSSTFAFAATKSEKTTRAEFGDCGIVGEDNDEVTLVKDSKNNDTKFDLNSYIGGMKLTTEDKTEHDVTVDAEDITVKHSSGKSLVSITKNSKNSDKTDGTMLRVKKDETGTEKLMVYGEATITRDDDKEYTVKGYKEFTVNVVATDERFVGLDAKLGDHKRYNDTIPALEINANDYDPKEVKVYRAVPTIVVSESADKGNLIADYVDTKTDDDDKAIRIEGSVNSKFKINDQDTGSVKDVTKITNKGNGTGTLKLTVKSNTNKSADENKYTKTYSTTTATILKKVAIPADAKITIQKIDSKTRIVGSAKNNDMYNVKDSWNLNGYDFTGVDASSTITVKDGVSVGDIKHFHEVTVEDKAKTGAIKDMEAAGGKITVKGEGTVVGAIDVADDDDGEINVTMDEGRIASINTKGNVEINGGTVTGDVTVDDETSSTIDIDSSDDEINTVIGGTVEGKDITVGASSDEATTKISKIIMDDDATITLNDTNVQIGTLNADYEGNVEFEDFHGTIASLINPQDITADEDTEAVIKGDVNAKSIDIDEDGVLEFTGAVDVDSISGSGKIVVGADKLMINEDASSGLTLKLAGANVNVGDVAYKAKADVADVDTFAGVGFSVEKSASGKTADKFLVKNVQFAGVALNKTSIEIAKDYSETVTVANYPAAASLPTGAKIVWDYSDADKDVFAVTENGNSITIKAIGFDSRYATSNDFDLIATVVDADGDVIENYEDAKCVVTAIAEPKVACDLSGIVEVAQGSTKNFTFTSTNVATPSLGNGAVAVTGTVSAFANGKATYAVKATGAVGTTTGVYANIGGFAKQAFVVKVVAPKVIVDTTVNFALAKGNRYVYKVTAPTKPAFTVGNGAVIATQAGKVVGNDYYFVVYAVGNAGQSTGVYVNGVKANAITIK